MDRFKCLEAFIKIIETGSVSQAARALDLSKSTVSERLAQLERLVGEPLIARSTRKVSATAAGRRIYSEFRRTAAHLRKLEKAVDADRLAIEPLRIASTTDMGAIEVAQVLADYCAENVGADLSLSVGNDLVDPLDRGFDMTIHFRRIVHAKLKVEEIAFIECGLYASPSYLSQAGRPTCPSDLRDHTCLGYMFQPSVHDWIPNRWEFTQDGQTETVHVQLRARFNSGIAMRRFAVAGLGLAILPEIRVRDEVAKGQLERVLPYHAPPLLRLFAIYPRIYIGNQQIQNVVRYLRKRLGELL